MPTARFRLLDEWKSSLRTLILGPQLLAFMPAITLGAYWLGGEFGLVVVALLVPAAFGLAGLFGSSDSFGRDQHDPVTGLALRPALVKEADRIIAESASTERATAAFAVGLDNSDELSSRFDEATRDAVYLACADRLAGILREGDRVARLDKSRFGIVLGQGSRADLETLIQIASRIQRTMTDPVSVDRTRVFASVSVGFSSGNKVKPLAGETLLSAAEAALDDAIASGAGSVRAFSPEMRERARAQLVLSDELPKALESGQIVPWFQPQISAETGAVSGFEVLARWEHPERGIIPPAQFLSVASDHGLMGRLLEVMLYESLAALRTWDTAGLQIPGISLNFSEDELRNPEIAEKISWELDRFGIGASRLTVEILETVIALAENDTINRNIRALRDLGCPVDLDDFGTGHASIANIKRFAVDRIKIDRSFITQIDTDNEQQKLVSAILTMAESLGLATLAEGVENNAEHGVLRRLGCDYIQGFGVARPMPAGAVADWVREYENRLVIQGDKTAQVQAPTVALGSTEASKTA